MKLGSCNFFVQNARLLLQAYRVLYPSLDCGEIRFVLFFNVVFELELVSFWTSSIIQYSEMLEDNILETGCVCIFR
jgi:hypothetical protein